MKKLLQEFICEILKEDENKLLPKKILTKAQAYEDSLSDQEKFARAERSLRDPYIDRGKYNSKQDVKFEKVLKNIRKKFEEKYGQPIGVGTQRITFRWKNWVFKVPRNYGGVNANEYEHSVGKANPNAPGYPITKLFYIKQIPILKMEYVDPINYSDPESPEWAACFDCGQVGKTKKGKIVPYDYGSN